MIYLCFALALFAVIFAGAMAGAFFKAAQQWRKAAGDLEEHVRQLETRQEALTDEVGKRAALLEAAVDYIGPVWQTGLGRAIRMADMTECHLRNAIAWCEENGHSARRLRDELKQRRYNRRMEMAGRSRKG